MLKTPRREIFAWAMFDFANSGYTTVVLTAVFSAYFVDVVAGGSRMDSSGTATLLWTLAMAVSNLLVVLSAPVLGALADYGARKKRYLAFTTIGCVVFTVLLGFTGPGDIWFGMGVVIISSFMFATGENLIAAFLPEIAHHDDMGRISGYGWSLGYIGGLVVLGLCLAYISWAEGRGHTASEFVPVTMWITAAAFALAAIPTFLWLRERATPQARFVKLRDIWIGFLRVGETVKQVRRFRDLFRFLITLTIYYSGIITVVVLAAVYARQVMHFNMRDTVLMILVVNVTAAIGAYAFGVIQDRLGSARTLAMTLVVWIAALVLAYFAEDRATFWVVANLVGLALGSSQSAGRALVGQFTPAARSAEFFGLWGLAGKLAAIVGPMCYGLVTYLSHGNHRLGLLVTTVFFIVGLIGLATVNENRGRAAAQAAL
jgi:UMF1 family MFS transporter